MVGRLLTTIDAEIRSTTNPLRRQCLFAERAGILARIGEFEEARSLLNKLRAANTDYDPLLTSRILLAEGLICHFAYDTAGARDKFRRVYAIGTAVADQRLKSLAAAWLSVNELNYDNVPAAVEHATEAIRDASPSDHGALARAHLVVADLLNHAGEQSEAKRHYDIARQHAVDEGDLSMQSLVLYNIATFGVHQLALDAIAGPVSRERAHLVEMHVASIRNLDSGIGNKSLSRLVPIQHGQILALQGNWQSALDRFDDHIESAHKDGMEHEALKALCARVLCHRGLENFDPMKADLDLARQRLTQCSELDDLAIANHRLATALADSAPEEASYHHATAIRCLQAFRARQASDLQQIRQRLLSM